MPIVTNRNAEQEDQILRWIEQILEISLPDEPFEDVLKDGVILCKLINRISPGSVKKIAEQGSNFQLMENIQRFQAAIRKYGVPDEEIFQTADLFERRNLKQVALCLFALGRITQLHPEYQGPRLGPKMAAENRRNFSEEQVRKMRDAEVGLQYGSNKGATQAGQNLGLRRHM